MCVLPSSDLGPKVRPAAGPDTRTAPLRGGEGADAKGRTPPVSGFDAESSETFSSPSVMPIAGQGPGGTLRGCRRTFRPVAAPEALPAPVAVGNEPSAVACASVRECHLNASRWLLGYLPDVATGIAEAGRSDPPGAIDRPVEKPTPRLFSSSHI